MNSSWKDRIIDCPYCFDGLILGNICNKCGQSISIRSGIPSVIANDTKYEHDEKLSMLAEATTNSLDEILENIRDDYMDGSIIDRFFKTRTVNWRILVQSHLSGRGMILGSHDEKVGIILSEILDEVYTIDTSLPRLQAQTAVANASDTSVKPLHSDVSSLPFPTSSFDTIVLQCRAKNIHKYLSEIRKYLTADGVVLLLVNGWVRESGLTGLVGLGKSSHGISERIHSVIFGHLIGIKRSVHNSQLSINEQYALISTNRHENERVFEIRDEAALEWLLDGSPKTAGSARFLLARFLSQAARKARILQQCYPRYLVVCQMDKDINGYSDKWRVPEESILISGKNRSTILEFSENKIERIRKVPNSNRQSKLNENACKATGNISGVSAESIPKSELVTTELGSERHEQPVDGTPLDQRLEPVPGNINKHLNIVFNWLINFQKDNTVEWIEKDPSTVENELCNDYLGLSNPPIPNRPVSIPKVITHGDFFGSNIYLKNDDVGYVIDWEWASNEGNPMVDAGFILLQLAEYVGENFKEGFDLLFIEDDQYMKHIYSMIKEYCDSIDINADVFIIYLCISYIQRSRTDMKINKRLDIDWPDRVQYIWNNYDILIQNIQLYAVDY